MPKLKDFITAENQLDGSEYAYISQLDKTRKTTYQKIKEWLLGTTALTTTDKTITGAIQELKGKVDTNTTSLSEKANVEVGNFTPTFTSGTYTFSTQVGRYQKIGKIVTFQLQLSLSGITTAGNASIIISGLPFNAVNTTVSIYPVTIMALSNITFSGQINARIANSNSIHLMILTSNSVYNLLQYSALSATSSIFLAGTYEIA